MHAHTLERNVFVKEIINKVELIEVVEPSRSFLIISTNVNYINEANVCNYVIENLTFREFAGIDILKLYNFCIPVLFNALYPFSCLCFVS